VVSFLCFYIFAFHNEENDVIIFIFLYYDVNVDFDDVLKRWLVYGSIDVC
jgi:hypothetical protein